MIDSYPLLKNIPFPSINRKTLQTLQVNLGYRCNLQCNHCHVGASPYRKEVMSESTIEEVIEFVDKYQIKQVDLTGGAPELHPQFLYLVKKLSNLNCKILLRSNLSVLQLADYHFLMDELVKYQLVIMASMPCYLEENVDKQRGKGTFNDCIKTLKELNQKGYAHQEHLIINLIYNPQGAELPPQQASLEIDDKKHLLENYDIYFNHLLTITNLPINRFGSVLISTNQFDSYMTLLRNSFDKNNLEQVMCRELISVDWEGYCYDCDFNQMLDLGIQYNQDKIKLSDYHPFNNQNIPIEVAGHCYGCTAGAGSSCGGSLT